MGDGETTVGGTLHGTEDTVTGGGADETDIEESSHGAFAFLEFIERVVSLAINFLVALVLVSKLEVSQETTSAKETSSVSGSIVSQTSMSTVMS